MLACVGIRPWGESEIVSGDAAFAGQRHLKMLINTGIPGVLLLGDSGVCKK